MMEADDGFFSDDGQPIMSEDELREAYQTIKAMSDLRQQQPEPEVSGEQPEPEISGEHRQEPEVSGEHRQEPEVSGEHRLGPEPGVMETGEPGTMETGIPGTMETGEPGTMETGIHATLISGEERPVPEERVRGKYQGGAESTGEPGTSVSSNYKCCGSRAKRQTHMARRRRRTRRRSTTVPTPADEPVGVNFELLASTEEALRRALQGFQEFHQRMDFCWSGS